MPDNPSLHSDLLSMSFSQLEAERRKVLGEPVNGVERTYAALNEAELERLSAILNRLYHVGAPATEARREKRAAGKPKSLSAFADLITDATDDASEAGVTTPAPPGSIFGSSDIVDAEDDPNPAIVS